MPVSSQFNFWEVVGGADKGGILVRRRYALTSDLESTRLASGSIIRQIEKVGERLHYKLTRGAGPDSGWISLRMNGKDLVVPSSFLPEESQESNGIVLSASDTDSSEELPELLSTDETDVEFALKSLQYMSADDLSNLVKESGFHQKDCITREALEQCAREALLSSEHSKASIDDIQIASCQRSNNPSYNESSNPYPHSKLDMCKRSCTDKVFRCYRVSSDRPAAIFETSSLESKSLDSQGSGAFLLATGNMSDTFIEVLTLLNRRGWMNLDDLVPVQSHGWHGDCLPQPIFGFDRVLQEHKLATLRLCLPAVHVRDIEVASLEESLVKHGQRAHLFGASFGDGAPLPLLIALHGAGKGLTWKFDEFLETLRKVHQEGNDSFLVLVPEASDSTWDLIKAGTRHDIDFIQWSLDEVRRRYHVDDNRIAIAGYSDGGSIALSLVLRNPNVFQAALAHEAGFCIMEPHMLPKNLYKPKLFLEYRNNHVMKSWALTLKQKCVFAGHQVEFRFIESEGCDSVQSFFWSEACTRWLSMRCRSCKIADEREEQLDLHRTGNDSDVDSDVESASELEMSGHIMTGGIYR